MAAPATFDSFSAELSRLTGIFEKNFAHYKKAGYDEASLRQEFLNPLFSALGWDVENKAGRIPQKREVEVESRTQIGGRAKRADYLFRTDGSERFVCEAKKPADDLGDRAAFQAKRYAWNKDLPLALLTDFEEMKVYVVGGKPHADEPHVGEWKTWHFRQYPLIAQEIWDLFSREKVASGAIDTALDALPKKMPSGKGKAKQQWLIRPDRSRALDHDFLEFLDEARRDLASDLYKHNDHDALLEGNLLNESVQCILDRILFLRICEDRDIDTGTTLQSIVETWRRNYGHDEGRKFRQESMRLREDSTFDLDDDARTSGGGSGTGSRIAAPRESLWYAIVRHFRALDRRPPSHVPFFNGNLFKLHGSERLLVGDAWLADFIGELSNDETPYLFNVIPVEILGSVYERFLGKVVRPHGKGIIVEEKPEVRKAGGVYYTPRYIVDYIVEQTVGKLVEGVAPEKSLALRILDPACGSGSFLIRAFERVCEHWQEWLTENADKRKKKWCWVDKDTGDVHLTVALKREILTENIYGVDLDSAAVEVTQLSLYLKMLENENRTTLQRERELFADEIALLPPLQDNIKCGNSLIASDFSMMSEDLVRVNAFDWEVGFREIMKAGGFDAVIGNPPYIRIQGFPEDQVAYFIDNYRAATGNYDIYVNFVERGFGLLSKKGRFGMILPNKFFRTDYGVGLRSVLADNRAVSDIVNFGAEQVFEATTYTCLLFLSRSGSDSLEYATAKADAEMLAEIAYASRPAATLTPEPWTFADESQTRLLEKLKAASVRLLDLPAEMSRGSSTGDDEIFVVEAKGHGLEEGILRTPLFASDFGRYHFTPEAKWRVIFPYVAEKDGFRLIASSELQKKYPKTFEHLQQNSRRLRERKQFKEWFGYSAPRNLELHDRAQIAVPLLADGGLFALIPKSSRGTVCPMASGGFTVTLGNDCAFKPEFVLGILNSKLAFWFLGQVSNVFRGGWITCTKQYFGELPIVRLEFKKPADKARHDKLVMLVEKMLALTPKLRAATKDLEKATLQNAVSKTDHDIDALVYDLYALTPDEIALVEGGK